MLLSEWVCRFVFLNLDIPGNLRKTPWKVKHTIYFEYTNFFIKDTTGVLQCYVDSCKNNILGLIRRIH